MVRNPYEDGSPEYLINKIYDNYSDQLYYLSSKKTAVQKAV